MELKPIHLLWFAVFYLAILGANIFVTYELTSMNTQMSSVFCIERP